MLRIIILLGGGRALSQINQYHFMFSSRFMLFQIFLENKLLVRRGGGVFFIKNKKLPLIFMFCEGK